MLVWQCEQSAEFGWGSTWDGELVDLVERRSRLGVFAWPIIPGQRSRRRMCFHSGLRRGRGSVLVCQSSVVLGSIWHGDGREGGKEETLKIVVVVLSGLVSCLVVTVLAGMRISGR